MKMRLGPILLISGITLLIFGTVAGMVTVVADNTPPNIISSSPAPGYTYNLLSCITIYVEDPESGVASVSFTDLTTATTYELEQTMTNTWRFPPADAPDLTATSPVNNLGNHQFGFSVLNKAGLESSLSGTYTIYTDLVGTWYVQEVKITDPGQIIYVQTLTVQFKFVKTTGIEDSKISCTATWTGPTTGSVDIPLDPAYGQHTWFKAVTFTEAGSYNVELKADDTFKTITMSIFQAELGSEEPWIQFELPGLHLLQWLGLVTTGFGIIVIVVESKKK